MLGYFANKAVVALSILPWLVSAQYPAFAQSPDANLPITVIGLFDKANGDMADGGVVFDSHGNLFGTTRFGGADGQGTVYEISKGSHRITVLASFNGKNGYQPWSGVTLDRSGNIFGTTVRGGSNDDGTIYKIANASQRITVLASFNGKNGAFPAGGVALDNHGTLYGAAFGGGAFHKGTVYEIAKGSHHITVLASFNGTNGDSPQGSVVLDNRGNIYVTQDTRKHDLIIAMLKAAGAQKEENRSSRYGTPRMRMP